MEKRYLGDGVYVEIENGMFKLTTGSTLTHALGRGITNTIYLEPEVYEALELYAHEAFTPKEEKERG